MIIERRKFLTGFGALIAAPAIARAGSLMPVRGIVMPVVEYAPTTFYMGAGKFFYTVWGDDKIYEVGEAVFDAETNVLYRTAVR